MPRMSKKRKLEWSFFLNNRNRITYNSQCRQCRRLCKQSFRAIIVDCPPYQSKRAKEKENGR
ncbi:MAG: hypothetical protein PHE02_06495 [Lachnospiraceae bacterium]|nr:hypothetical protein [Lachnospiraceae bacterium]